MSIRIRFSFYSISDADVVCDNCTLTLLASSDDLTYLLESEAKHLDLDGIPAPWPRLLQFENISVRLDRKLDNFLEAKNCIEDYDDSNIEKVNNLIFHFICARSLIATINFFS